MCGLFPEDLHVQLTMSWRPNNGVYMDEGYRLVYPDGKLSSAKLSNCKLSNGKLS
jgi:hypothetical protein